MSHTVPMLTNLLAQWVHDLDPFLIQFTDTAGIRWYGLAYIFGLFAGWYLCRRFAEKGLIPLTPQQAGDLTTAIGIGMIAGGRLGYCIGYAPELFITFKTSLPFWGVLDVGNGGMASHGGILGFFAACAWYCWRNKIHFLIPCDIVAVVAPIGVFCGRVANFINGELWGRTTDVAWGVIFPAAIRDVEPGERAVRFKEFQDANPDVPHNTTWDVYEQTLVQGTDAWFAFYRAMVEARHPSQLYACMLEGGLVFLISYPFFARHRRPGLSTATVLFLYGTGRFFGEFYREPDPGYQLIMGWMSKGQLYTIPFLIIAAVAIYLAYRKPSRPELYIVQPSDSPSTGKP